MPGGFFLATLPSDDPEMVDQSPIGRWVLTRVDDSGLEL